MAAALMQHIEKRHTQMPGDRKGALTFLKTFAWIPSHAAASPDCDYDESRSRQALMALEELFPAQNRNWSGRQLPRWQRLTRLR